MNLEGARERFARVPFAQFLGVAVVELESERAVLRLPFQEDNANVGGVLHGGATASLINMAGTLAAWTGIDLQAQPGLGTVDLSVQYLAAAHREEITAEAAVLRRGRDIFFLDVTVRGAKQQLLSKGMMIYRAPHYANQPVRSYAATETIFPPLAVLTPPESTPDQGDFTHKLQMTTLAQRPGLFCLKLPCVPAHTDEQGRLHPGALASLLDTAGTHAAWSMVRREGSRGATVGMQLSYTELAGLSEDVIAEAHLQRRSEEIFASLVQITTASTRQLVAMGTVSYRLIEAP